MGYIAPRNGIRGPGICDGVYGLLMMRYYLEEILDGKKDCDTRLFPTEKRGTVALVDSSSFKVRGLAELTEVAPIPYDEFVKWHRTGPFAGSRIAPYAEGRTCYAYMLRNVRRPTVPVGIGKDENAHVWVRIPDETAKSFGYQKTLFRSKGAGRTASEKTDLRFFGVLRMANRSSHPLECTQASAQSQPAEDRFISAALYICRCQRRTDTRLRNWNGSLRTAKGGSKMWKSSSPKKLTKTSHLA